MKKLFCTILFLIFSVCVYSQSLSFKYSTNNIYRLKVYTKQDIYIDGVFFRTVEAMSKITLQPYGYKDIDNERYVLIKYLFYYLNKKQNIDVEYKLSKVDEVDFMINPKGDLKIIGGANYLPPRRNIPSFNNVDVAKGTKWQSKGEDVFTEKDEIVEVPSIINYSVDDITMKDGKTIVVFNASYDTFFNVPNGKYLKDIRIKSSTKYNWDIIQGIFSEYRELFEITKNYLSTSGYQYSSAKFQGTSVGVMEVVSIDVAKQYKLARELEKISSEVTVSPPENNEIKLNISDILFDKGSWTIKDAYREMLKKVAEVLKQYKEIDIVVEGHTDDTGTREFNLSLSENRARAVANALIQSGISSDKVSYRGFGPDRPLVPNTSEENRSRNRRVEIKLIWGK
ncbi:MAG: OmpA family protein [Brevinematia bacterium]